MIIELANQSQDGSEIQIVPTKFNKECVY